ncbi:hypothetical protein FF38_07242 [Lucilia cuprina]|uniref:Uncharacterized protein n=1 Tax=Lucilia cuprina TaxID=7375 RepID=A0A0L0C4U6_LUCCU|nr:hypothetical protein FF38_07242 [Lucilia cuprina]
MTSGSSNTDILDLKYDIVRLGRGKYGFGGFMDFKVDFYDDVKIGGTIERSKYRAGPYSMFPMSIQNESFSSVMSKYYKHILQPVLEKCCDNAPIVKDKFEAPLTKRYVSLNNCALTTDNLPNVIMEGYYRLRLTFSGPLNAYVETLSFVETKIF